MANYYTMASTFCEPEVEKRLLAAMVQDPSLYFELMDHIPAPVWTENLDLFRMLAEAIETESEMPLIDATPGQDPEADAKRLADLFQKRQAASVVDQFMDDIRQEGTDATALISSLEQKLAEVQKQLREVEAGQMVAVPSMFDTMLQELYAKHEVVKEKGSLAVGLPTGLPMLDKLLGGLQKGIHLVAAEPGQGKTTLCLQIGRSVAKQRIPVLFVSFEESLDRLSLKALCSAAGLNVKRYAEGWGSPEELKPAIHQHSSDMKHLHLIQGTKNYSVSRLKAQALQAMNRAGADQCLIIVDYLQRWAGHSKEYHDFRHIVRNLTGELRDLSHRLNSPVVLISSQNRGGQGTNRLSSLKESGDLEYEADSAWFLTKSEDRPVNGTARMVDLFLEKNRFGDKGRVDLVFRAEQGSFREEHVR